MKYLSLKLLAKRLLLSLCLFSICRLLFFVFNYHFFAVLSGTQLVGQFIFGLQYDLMVLLAVHLLFILLHFVGWGYFQKTSYQLFLKVLFIVSHVPIFILELIDTAYFPYNLKRTTVGALAVGAEGTDQFWMYFKSFWYLYLLLFGLLSLLFYAYAKLDLSKQELKSETKKPLKFASLRLVSLFSLIAIVFWLFVGADGKFVTADDATDFGESRFVPLHTNTSFVFLFSCFVPPLELTNDLTEEEANQISPYYQTMNERSPLGDSVHPNVVIIIWESLSKEYVGYFNKGKGYTPFFDSLCSVGMLCNNAFANAKHSNEGVCAVLSGMPTLMEDCFYTSAYQADSIIGLGTYLQSFGYRTAFYHGGNNGTMRFNTFSKRCGFDKYIGRNEYPQKDRDYDGNWGIWDEPFLQFFGQQLNVQKEPFCATIFTVSSHHPYSIPKQYEGKLPAGPLEIEQTVAYTDLALRSFFHSIASMPWYQNTLFIITADHTSISEDPKYASRVGTFSIPILYYYPGKKLRAAYYERVTQQIDILPSVLQFCNYKGPFTTFGKSVFESTPTKRFALTYLNRTYQLINDSLAVEFAAGEVKTVQRYKEATTLKNQVILSKKDTEILTKQLLARKQLYSKTIIKNQLFPTKALD